MVSIKDHIQTHGKKVVYHFKRHHKKYIFGMVGGALITKLLITLVTSLGLYESLPAFAQEVFPTQEFVVSELTGDVETTTGDVETTTGDVETTTGDIETTTGDVETTTGDIETTTGDIETTTGDVETTTGDIETTTGDIETTTGDIETTTGDIQTGGFIDVNDPEISNNSCDQTDFNFLNPLSGSIVKGDINISRTYNNTDCSSKDFDIYLRDHNNQRIMIGTSSYNNIRHQFDSSKLYSGFYDILSSTGLIVYSGEYSGLNSTFYTGYKIRFLDQSENTLYESDYFTIDNQKPTISGINLSFTGNYNLGYIGLSGIVNLTFTASEELTGLIVNILGQNANLITKSGLQYSFRANLTNQNSGTNVYYKLDFQDLAANTGTLYGTSNVIFDKEIPVLYGLIVSGTNDNLSINRSGNEITKTDFIYALTGNNTGELISNTGYSYTGLINITGLDEDEIYNFNLIFTDPVNNKLSIGGNFHFTTTGIVIFSYNTISTSNNSGTLLNFDVSTGSTGNISTIANVIKQEVSKFNECKDSIKLTKINIKVNEENISLNMPNFEKSYVRTIVNSFTIVVMDKLQQKQLEVDDLELITKRFDDFLLILKLVRDDENQCKQNLSNYHIRLFQKTLSEYNISVY